MKLLLTTICSLIFCASAFGQLESDEYTREFIWGVNKNTNSGLVGGVSFKLARQQKENLYAIYGLEFMNVRHPKEQKYLSPSSGTSFIWGKQNHLYSIRMIYGRERLLYKKAPQQGVQISMLYGGGPTLGIIAPYYILYNSTYVPYDPEKHRSFNSIQGSGKLLQGLGESNLTVGLNAKAGLSFEFGAFKNNVAGVEMGAAAEIFPKEIVIVPTQKNRSLYTSLYFTLYWGTRR